MFGSKEWLSNDKVLDLGDFQCNIIPFTAIDIQLFLQQISAHESKVLHYNN